MEMQWKLMEYHAGKFHIILSNPCKIMIDVYLVLFYFSHTVFSEYIDMMITKEYW